MAESTPVGGETAASGPTPPDAATAGTYELLRDRLRQAADDLRTRAEALDADRVAAFGSAELALVASMRIPTERPSLARCAVSVGDLVLAGFDTDVEPRTATSVGDILRAWRLRADAGAGTGARADGDAGHVASADLVPVGSDDPGVAFLADQRFVADVRELFDYYTYARLLDLRRVGPRLLVVFQTGESVRDTRVLRFDVAADGTVSYVDAAGANDDVVPDAFDFDWSPATREDQVGTRTPRIRLYRELLVDAVGGSLDFRLASDSTATDGRLLLSERVDDKEQSIDDAEVASAHLGDLILVSVKPYNESAVRYFVFDRRLAAVERLDAIGQSCRRLPDDHGIVFCGGYHLVAGLTKTFDKAALPADASLLRFHAKLDAPNGEDVLYVFGAREHGDILALSYNLVRKEMAPPISARGIALLDDGRAVIVRPEPAPGRVHAFAVWQTPYTSELFAAAQPVPDTPLARIGNAEVVRGVSDALTIVRLVLDATPSTRAFEGLVDSCTRALDAYPWLGAAEGRGIAASLSVIADGARAIVGEYAKVEAQRRQAATTLADARRHARALLDELGVREFASAADCAEALAALRREQGTLLTLRDVRAIDLAALTVLTDEVAAAFATVGARSAEFLTTDAAFAPFADKLTQLGTDVAAAASTPELDAVGTDVESLAGELGLLGEVVGGLTIDDPAQRTAVLERIAELLGTLNRTRAALDGRRAALAESEGAAAFAAEFALLSQRVASELTAARTPDACDDGLARLLASLEGLESRFADSDRRLAELAEKRDEIYEAFGARKQGLVDAQAASAGRLKASAERVLVTVARRSVECGDAADVAAFFAADPLVAKVRDSIVALRQLGDSVAAAELDARLHAAADDAVRQVRDKAELFEDGGDVLRLGHHRFGVNNRPLELTFVPADGDDDRMQLHITGTDFRQPVTDPAFLATRPFWNQTVVSEDHTVYRGEFLAVDLAETTPPEALAAARAHPNGLAELVRDAAAARYDEGYERGVHDADAAAILDAFGILTERAGLLCVPAAARAAAQRAWVGWDETLQTQLLDRARAAVRLRALLGAPAAAADLATELARRIGRATSTDADIAAGRYLLEELGAVAPAAPAASVAPAAVSFVVSRDAADLLAAFNAQLAATGAAADLDAALAHDDADPIARHQLATAWVAAFAEREGRPEWTAVVDEAVVLRSVDVARRPTDAVLHVRVDGLAGNHPRIVDGTLDVRADELAARVDRFRRTRVPGFRAAQQIRRDLLADARRRLRLDDYRAKPMSDFMRNGLIDDVLLGLVGDSLARQLGTVDDPGVDRSGMLLMLSPPGYGKTTLMEYVANRLGMVFVKVNGPALGAGTTSLDPADAPDATARGEIEKIVFAFALGRNVMLYLDDVQHCSPQLLERFIPLADAQRRIEAVWDGEARVFDLRRQRFAVVMAANPYTESGERFRIPDMLANRSDVVNLGDVLAGRDDLFARSYLENAFVANPVLAPLAKRSRHDLDILLRMAGGETLAADSLEVALPAGDLADAVAVLTRLGRLRDTVLAVNAAYVASAQQAEGYRTEPPFLLQGSYRNMGRLAAKVSPLMTDAELDALLDEHYAHEAQTLTTGAESNLLAFAAMRGTLDETRRARWDEIRATYRQRQADADSSAPLRDVAARIAGLGDVLAAAVQRPVVVEVDDHASPRPHRHDVAVPPGTPPSPRSGG